MYGIETQIEYAAIVAGMGIQLKNAIGNTVSHLILHRNQTLVVGNVTAENSKNKEDMVSEDSRSMLPYHITI